MSNDVISSWIEKAKTSGDNTQASGNVKVIRREQNRGTTIMEIADKLLPWFTKMFEGVRDENGMLMQRSRVRGIALNVAQSIVKEQEQKNANA